MSSLHGWLLISFLFQTAAKKRLNLFISIWSTQVTSAWEKMLSEVCENAMRKRCECLICWFMIIFCFLFVLSASICMCLLACERISVVCLSLSQDWRQARNKRERVNALSSPTFWWVFYHLTHFGAGQSFWNTCIELHHKDQAAAFYIGYDSLGLW